MQVQVLATKPRGDGWTEVTLSAEGVRFTIVIESRIIGTGGDTLVYRAAAEHQVAEMARLREITTPGRLEREA